MSRFTHCCLLAYLLLAITPRLQSQDECVPPDNCYPTIESKAIGRTNKGGYSFDYQSQRGKGCRRYRVRNTPAGLLTPMKWEDNVEKFMEVDISPCASGKTCDWLCSDLTSDDPPISGKTHLGYGLNREEHNDYPDAFRKGPKPPKYPPVSAAVTGPVAGLGGKPVQVTVKVTSIVYGDEPPYSFTYLIDAKGTHTFEILPPGSTGSSSGDIIGVVWEAPGIGLFEAVKRKGTMSIQPTGGRVAIEDIKGTSVVLDDQKNKELVLLQGTKRIFAMTAPAYHPK